MACKGPNILGEACNQAIEHFFRVYIASFGVYLQFFLWESLGLLHPKVALMSRIERSYKFCKFHDFSLNSTRYTKIRCLNDFSVRCTEIYNFILIDHQAPACRFYKIYKIYDFLLTLQFFNKLLRNLQFFAFLCNANCPPYSADLRILQNLRFFTVNNKTQKDR